MPVVPGSEGALPEQVDKVIYDFGFNMGPFAMNDLVGGQVESTLISITLAAVTVLCAGVLILGLFVAALWQLEMVAVLVAIFCVAMLGLIGSMITFIADMNLSLQAAQLDWKLIGKPAAK